MDSPCRHIWCQMKTHPLWICMFCLSIRDGYNGEGLFAPGVIGSDVPAEFQNMLDALNNRGLGLH